MTSLPLALIYDAKHPTRAIQPDVVATLARSIERLGLRTPITVRPTRRIRDGQPSDVWEIVTGRHRAEAARKLGWAEIEAVVRECDEDDARLWEIAENLHRAELTVQERAEHITEWVRITGEKVKAQVGPLAPHPRGRPDQGINAAVRELGITRQEGQRANKIASIAPEAKEAAREAGIADNQSALLRVAREADVAKQLAVIKREREAAEEHKRNRESDRVIALTEAQQFAAWLMERCDVHELPMLISWVEGCKPKDVTAALRREAA